MNDKTSSRIDNFFNGKGFYIVLIVCAAVIGVSSWFIFKPDSKNSVADHHTGYTGIGNEDGLYVPPETDIPSLSGNNSEGTAAPDTNIGGSTAGKIDIPDVPVISETNTAPSGEQVSETSSDLTFVMPLNGAVSMEYSVDYPVYNRTMADWRTHDGVDIAAEKGVTVSAASSAWTFLPFCLPS